MHFMAFQGVFKYKLWIKKKKSCRNVPPLGTFILRGMKKQKAKRKSVIVVLYWYGDSAFYFLLVSIADIY